MPVYEELTGEKLERRDIFITIDGVQQKVAVDQIRAQFRGGMLPGELPVLVTVDYGGRTQHCGEGSVEDVVRAWESAPLESYELQDVRQMIREFSFPEYEVTSKAEYHDLKRLHQRCTDYHRYIGWHDEEFKRLTKAATKEIVFLLDSEDPTWDASKGEERFAQELRKRRTDLVRNMREQKARIEHVKEVDLRRRERRIVTDTRNNLTTFPHKDLEIEIKDFGSTRIRDLKVRLREGSASPETLVRYRAESEWVELSDFLADWMSKKASAKQIGYLEALQRQHGITAEIALDCSRKEASERIAALAPSRDYD